MNNNIIILAGGIGSRLWPLSSEAKPKQFVKLNSEHSLLNQTIKRAKKVCGNGKIIIITCETMLTQVNDEIAKLSDSTHIVVLGEPMRRNTAAAILLGLAYLKGEQIKTYPCLVLASDHIIQDQQKFQNDIAIIQNQIEQNSCDVILFGIQPQRADTGFGYIETSHNDEKIIKDVISFKEKPNGELAEKYFKSGNYLWNSGMFYFDPNHFYELYKKYASKLVKLFEPLFLTPYHLWDSNLLKACFEKAPKLPVDKVIIEHADSIKVKRAQFDWNDVGSWNDVSNLFMTSDLNTTAQEIKSSSNFAITSKPVVFCGVDDLVVIEGKEGFLVAKRNQAHLIAK